MAPEILDPGDRNRFSKAVILIGILLCSVVHTGVAIASIRQVGIAAQFVGVDVAADPDVGGHERLRPQSASNRLSSPSVSHGYGGIFSHRLIAASKSGSTKASALGKAEQQPLT